MRFKRRKGKQITKAKKHLVDGITFASGLELYCYRALKKAKIPNEYEGKTFELVEKFKFEGLLMDKGKIINSGSPVDVITPKVMKDIYNLNVKITKNPFTGNPYMVHDYT